MPTQVQFRRGTTAQNNNFIGAAGEIAVDLDRMVLRVHDGVTTGGTAMLTTSGTATNAVNIVGGTQGDVPYQDSTGVTRFINIGAAGQVLSSDGTTATWVDVGSLTGGGGISADDVFVSTQTSGDRYLVVADQNGNYVALEADSGTNAAVYNLATGLAVNSTLTVSKAILPSTSGIDIGSLANPFRSLYVTSGTVYIGSMAIEDINGSLTVNEQTIVTTATIGTLVANTATNIGGGTAGQIVYQTAPGTTSFAGPGNLGEILVSGGNSAPVYTSTSSIYVGNAATANALNAGNTSTQQVGFANVAGVLLAANTATQQVGFANVAGVLLAANTATQQVGFANVAGVLLAANTATQQVGFANVAGSLLPANTSTQYVGNAAVANILNPANTSTQYVGYANIAASVLAANTSSQQVGFAANLLGGTAGGLVYQSAADATTFLTIGAGNTVLTSNGSAPVWSTALSLSGNLTVGGNLTVNGTTTYVNSTVTNIVDPIITIGGAADGQPSPSDDNKDRGIAFRWYTSGAAKTGFFGFDDSSGFFTFVPDATISGGEVMSGTKGAANINIAGGSTGQILYQSAANETGFIGPGSVGQILVSAGASIPVYTSTGSIYVGYAGQADSINILNTSTQKVGFAAEAGRLLAGSTSTMYVGFANKSNNIMAGTSGQLVYQSAADTTGFVGPGTAGQLLMSNGTSAPAYQSTLTVIGGTVNVTGVTASTTTATGALVVAGGLGVGGNLNVGGTVTVGIGSAAVSSSNGDLTLAATGGNVTTTNVVIISNTTGVTSAATGALQVAGGVGVGGGLFVGGIVTATSFVGAFAGSITGVATTATNLQNGTLGQVPYQSAPGVTSFYGPGTAGQLLVSGGAAVPVYTNTGSIYVGNAAVANILNAGNTSTQLVGFANVAGSLLAANTTTQNVGFADTAGKLLAVNTGTQYVGFANKSNNVIGGTSGQLVYQSNSDTTGFVGPGTAGQLLMSNGTSSPAYQSTLTVIGGTVNITSVTASTTTATGALVVAGGVGIGGDLRVAGEIFAQRLTIEYTTVTTTLVQTDDIIQTSNTTNATTTASGALQIAGGVGIGKDVYVGGTITHKGLVLTAGTAVDQVYTATKSLTLTNAWQDTGIAGTDLATGSYMVQIMANDSAAGGGQVNMYYTGVMSWYSAATGENAYSEIVLHRAGNAAAAGTVFLRVAEVSAGTLKLQISGTTINSGASNYAFSFRRMI